MKTMTKTITSYVPLAKIGIAQAVFGSQDIGGKTVEQFINHVVEGSQMDDPEKDLLSAYLIDLLNRNEDIESLETDLSYAISMLQRAKASIQQFLK